MSRSILSSVVLVALVLTGTVVGGPALALFVDDVEPLPPLEWPGAMAGGALDAPHPPLYLRAGAFRPLLDPLPRPIGLDGDSSKDVYLVQFGVPLSPALGERLSRVGVEVLGHVPEDGLAVRMPRPSVALSLARWTDVRWLCPWQDDWKVDTSILGAGGDLPLTVLTWPGTGDITRDLDGAGASVLDRLHGKYIVEAPASRVPDIAAIGPVAWIEPWLPPGLNMERAARTTGARQWQDGGFDPEGTAVWSYNAAADRFEGLTGAAGDVTVDVTDTGLDGSHPAFDGRKRAFTGIQQGMTPWTDPVGHGTHVAGIVLGDGSYRDGESPALPDGKYAGMAPQARLLGHSLYGPGVVFFYRNVTRWSVQNGADISQNSWGAVQLLGNYTDASFDYDNATRDADWDTPGNQSLLSVFSAGNLGYNGTAIQENTISPPGTAKNVITVGAVGNGKGYLSEDQMMFVSSRGWTDDGRIKPDLVAPGENVTSTWAQEDSGFGGALPPDSGTHSYIGYNGTSMSAPVVSGAAALVFDHLRTREDHAEPSPAVVKSILLASADHLPGLAWPGKDQGWGRLNLSRAIVGSATSNTVWLDQKKEFRSLGENLTLMFDVTAGTPITFSLVWTDLPSSVYVGKNLVNDLDIEVRSPAGQVYRGNHFSNGQSVTGGDADQVNNVEMVYLEAPISGQWEVTVRCAGLPPVPRGGVQDFALSVVGNVNKRFVDFKAENLSVRAIDKAEGDIVPVAFDLANIGNMPAGEVDWRMDILDEAGTHLRTLEQGTVSVDANSGVRVYSNWTAVRGTYTFKAIPNPLRSVPERSYNNNNASRPDVFIKGYGLSGQVKLPNQEGRPGTEVTFKLEVTNEGNVADLFLLTRDEPPTGWSARLEAAFLDVGPGGTGSTGLVVSVPPESLAWEAARINVTVRSQGNETYSVVLRTETQVEPVYVMTADLEERSLEAAPGGTADFVFVIQNLGNDLDTFKVSYEQTSGPTSGVGFDLPRSTYTADVGEIVEGNLAVSLDAALIDELPMDAQITFDLLVVSANNDSVRSAVPAVVKIEQLHKVKLTPPPDLEYVVIPGQEQSLAVELTNMGNGPDMVSPTIRAPEGWEWNTSQPSLLLEVGETKTAQLWVEVPNDALAGNHDVTVQVTVEDVVLDSTRLVFSVDWVPSISVRLVGSYDRNLTQGEELSMEFRVTNTGNRDDEVSVQFSGLSRGLRAEARPSTTEMAPDDIKSVVVVFNASSGAELLAGRYRVLFNYFEGLDTHVVQVNITIERRPVEPEPPKPDGDGGGGGVSTMAMGIIAIVVAVVLVAVLLTVFARRRREDHRLEETFFADRERQRSEATSEVLQEELSSKGVAKPPSGEEGVGGGTAPAPAPPTVAAPGAARCPRCGNAMQPVPPDGERLHCPVCGHEEGD